MSSIFLSHSSVDKPFVRKLAADLRRAGFFVWVDEAEIKVGDSLIEKIEEGIDGTDFLGVVLSSNSLKSEWVTREVRIALSQEIAGCRVKVLPLLLEKVSIPSFLLDKKYADFTTEEKYGDALQEVIRCLSELPEDVKKGSFSASEIAFYKEQLEKVKKELNVTRGERRLLLERLEKERRNIPEELQKGIESEGKHYPEFADVNRLYAFRVGGCNATAGYLLHCLRKEYAKGGPHQIVMICQLENKMDELSLLLEATLRRVAALQETGQTLVVL